MMLLMEDETSQSSGLSLGSLSSPSETLEKLHLTLTHGGNMKELWWLDFVDEGKLLGAAVVRADTMIEAVQESWRLELNREARS